ncbi:hypothetical protein [Kibdelosporangium phytohabitans]|uniref:Chaplin domain-containing protein n=1 Tax=Kibdelosporangium phytohabitans TaxID=860235 RepID=A0A0N9HPJ0_9PSEU|nr:hypothetical protein [Kibdelosporangium phytohabitans]ALG06593.1 hypothetical protein AOZ06_06340 [Kibdelosporangium phytohabitans]MBE1467791.1 hypothetical protein [Kibdelosporangium phytohabitans]
MKKLAVVTAAAAGLLMLGGPAFADNDVLFEDHAAPQVGLVNLQGIDVAKDINAAVNAGVCGTQALAIPVLSPIFVPECVEGGIDD